MIERRGSDNSNTSAEASWMDYSIRMHLRRHGSRLDYDSNYDSNDDSSSAYIAMAVPPLPPEYSDHDYDSPIRVPVAKLVEDSESPGRETLENGQTDEIIGFDDVPVDTDNTSESSASVQVEAAHPSPNTTIDSHNTQRNESGVNLTRRTILRQCFEPRRNRFDGSAASRFIIPRTSLPYTIEQDPLSLSWVAIIHVDQEIVDHGSVEEDDDSNVIAMSFATIEEAREACHAFAPPRMHSFEDYKSCFICKMRFHKVMRRPNNCRNCGICVCSKCSTNWPRSMLPETYYWRKNKRNVKVCFACDWLNETFRMSLMNGDHDKAMALQCTGNVNLRCPFAKTKHDIYYPVHCAILGGNLSTLKWLVDQHCCPITSSKKYRKEDTKHNEIGNEPILTSKGSSVLSLAMETHLLDFQKYLIVDKKVNIFEYTNLRVALRNLAFSLHHLPE
mmetsp:Transcript_16837/g.21295  ORF Transcript_16837/g.21295 Transcript_16837/m.21295 type:complete len:446 (+) Transcript_16837:3-1340(+)